MRMSTDDGRDEQLALETIAGGRRGGCDRVRHRTRVRARRVRARSQRAAARPRASGLRRGGDRAHRDEGRHDTSGWRVGAGRAREGDPRRLRREPRCAGWPVDRPLPDPRSRSADALADLGARAHPTRGRGPREAGRGVECEPRSAGRGARARPDLGGRRSRSASSTIVRSAAEWSRGVRSPESR